MTDGQIIKAFEDKNADVSTLKYVENSRERTFIKLIFSKLETFVWHSLRSFRTMGQVDLRLQICIQGPLKPSFKTGLCFMALWVQAPVNVKINDYLWNYYQTSSIHRTDIYNFNTHSTHHFLTRFSQYSFSFQCVGVNLKSYSCTFQPHLCIIVLTHLNKYYSIMSHYLCESSLDYDSVT